MTGSDGTPPARTTSRTMLLAVAGSAALAAAAGALFYYASQTAPKATQGTVHQVTVRDRACDPNEITVPAGRTIFEIHNASNRPLEWEILDGVMVVEERENITPGLRARLTARLRPGRYEITCGLLSNPRGTLTVTASAESEADRLKPPLKAFVGPLSEYRFHLVTQSSALTKAVARLVAAIRGGDLDAARREYVAARLPYRRIDMVTSRFSDLENAIDPVADYLAERENDPAFTGFHRIEYGLFAKNTLDGLVPVADELLAGVEALNTRIRALRLAPEDLATGVERQARLLAEGPIRRGENHYAGNDVAELAASLGGMDKSIDLLMPLLEGAAPDVVDTIDRARTDVHAAIDGLKPGQEYPRYDRVDDRARGNLAAAFTALADAVGKLNTSLGLEQP
jgi:iron uptake system component EfeO